MEITWYVYDGYLSGNRPKQVEIPDEEIAECETEENILALIEEYVECAFKEHVSYGYDESKCLSQALKVKQEYKEEEE